MKKLFVLILATAILLTSFAGCAKKPESNDVDLSEYSFVNKTWVRSTESCTETIRFKDDGSCSYSCSCGNPVNDDDLCEGYSFDPDTNTITYDFIETTDETITKIKVVSYDKSSLVLDFDGDERAFEIEKKNEDKSKLTYEGKEYVILEYNEDIFHYDRAKYEYYDADVVVPLEHEKWDFVYCNNTVYVLASDAEEASAYYKDDANYRWSVLVYPEDGSEIYIRLILSADDISYIYNMPNLEKDTTLFFDDIDVPASLVKTSFDGLIAGSTSLACEEGEWYWRSDLTDTATEGWPEYVFPLPNSIVSSLEIVLNSDE